MEPRILVGTDGGLRSFGDAGTPADALAGHTVAALAHDGPRTWALVDGRTLYATEDRREWTARAALDGADSATCLAPTTTGLYVGTEGAHLHRLQAGRLSPIDSFETVDGRKTWYTPWGDPADVRSIAGGRGIAEAIYVNVHVGGVVRSRDGGRSWTPTVDIESDVHQVLAHPSRAEVVLAAAADGFGVSRDSGASWRFITEGMHAHYLRAVAVSDDTVLVSASSGPGGRRAALYRKYLDGDSAFERCTDGLPTWFGDNVDTGCLAARGSFVACGTEDGRVFRSLDAGRHWDVAAKGLPAVTCLSLR
jgi:hypothetical protein